MASLWYSNPPGDKSINSILLPRLHKPAQPYRSESHPIVRSITCVLMKLQGNSHQFMKANAPCNMAKTANNIDTVKRDQKQENFPMYMIKAAMKADKRA